MTLDKILKSRIWPALWHLFARTFALLGLPLLAWGVDALITDRPDIMVPFVRGRAAPCD